jgi:transcriptional regulator with XRE-family HTH domain
LERMKLHTWLAENGKTATWLAEQTGLSVSQISRLVQRGGTEKRRPSLETCEKISAATGGEVTANDFMRKEKDRRVAREKLEAAKAA